MAAGLKHYDVTGEQVNEYATCIVEESSVVVQCLAEDAGTYIKVKYGTAADLSDGVESIASQPSAAEWDAIRVKISNLQHGQKYYYQVGYSDTPAGAFVYTDAPIRYFRIPYKMAAPFKFVVLSDLHLNGYRNYGTPTQVGAPAGGNHAHYTTSPDAVDMDTMKEVFVQTLPSEAEDDPTAGAPEVTASGKSFAATILEDVAPDFVVWLGDDVFTHGGASPYPAALVESTNNILKEAGVQTVYRGFHNARAAIGIPEYAVPGNHERVYSDLVALYPHLLTERQKTMLHPSNGVRGRYGFVDWGKVRLIFLDVFGGTTYANLLTTYSNYLDAEQRAWFSSVLDCTQDAFIVLFHQPLYNGNAAQFGGIVDMTGTDWALSGASSTIYSPLDATGKPWLVLNGHNHYCLSTPHTTVKNGVTFSVGSPFHDKADLRGNQTRGTIAVVTVSGTHIKVESVYANNCVQSNSEAVVDNTSPTVPAQVNPASVSYQTTSIITGGIF